MYWGQSYYSNQSLEKVLLTDSLPVQMIQDPSIYIEGWDTLAQVKFWRKVIRLQPELCLLNVASTREVLYEFPTIFYDTLSRDAKRHFKDSLRKTFNIPQGQRLYITYGKQDFYQLQSVIPEIDQAIPLFAREGVDPWYAQAILLIESPGRLQESPTGAYGPFQLMKYVGRQHGLTINEEVDERADFMLAAKASAAHFRNICIPETKRMLRVKGIQFEEHELWFRLLVLHVYHAGASNVNGALKTIRPYRGGMDLIRTLWQTRYRRFGNSSQNYSQVALATLLELDYILAIEGETICD